MTPVEVLRPVIQSGLVSCRTLRLPLVQLLTRKDCFQDSIKWQVNTSTSGTVGIAATASTPAASSDVVRGASLACGASTLAEVVEIPVNDIEQARMIGTQPLQNLLEGYFTAKLQKMLVGLEEYLFDGTGADAAGGVQGLAAVTAANGNYAGIDNSNYSAWAAYRDVSGSARDLDKALLQSAATEYLTRGLSFDMVLMSPALLAKFEDLFEAANSTVVPANQRLYNIGGVEFTYKGQPVIASPKSTANTVYFVNSADMSLHTRVATASQNMQEEGLNLQITQLMDKGRVARYEIAMFPQLQYYNRRSAGIIDNLNE